MSFELNFRWDGEAASATIKRKLLEGIEEGTEFLLGEANKIVPLDEATLLRSGETSLERETFTGCVSYDTPYARRLHEHPEYRFNRGRKGKWLEITLNSKMTEIFQHIASKIQF